LLGARGYLETACQASRAAHTASQPITRRAGYAISAAGQASS